MRIDLAKATREELVAYARGLELRVAWFERQFFGVKSEKLIPQDSKQQTFFFASEHIPEEQTTVKSYERKVRKKPTVVDGGEVRFSENVPVDEEVVFPKEIEGLPGDKFEVIGEKITERLVQIPSQYRVKRTIRKTVKIKETQTLHTAPAPEAVIERSFADRTLLASLLTDKFLYHLSLYRVHQRMRAAGITVSRGHLTKLVHRTLELLEPIYYSILSNILTSEMISMDETPIKAGRKEQGKMQTAWFWPVFAKNQVAFIYSTSRGQDVVARVITSQCKRLLSDGHTAYESYAKGRDDLLHAQCWAHVRRKFFEAKEHSPPESERALILIRRLFEIEDNIKEQTEEERLRVRGEMSRDVVQDFFALMDQLWFEKHVDKTSLLGQAVVYARNRKEGLNHFLNHADIPLSNNHTERTIRPVAVGRKNWLFCWSEVGAKYAAIAFTLVECCKLENINVWDYLVDVLQRIDTHPMREIQQLTPKEWKNRFCHHCQ